MRLESALALIMAAVFTSGVHAQSKDWEAEFDEEKKGWQEIQAQIPPYPKPENLIRVQTGSASGHQFFVDPTSISIGQDQVVRYIAVIKTAGGATNTLFEGMRCETKEQKLYAIAHRDGTWVRARASKWEHVYLKDLTPYRHTLYHDFFCANGKTPAPVRQVVDALKRGYGYGRSSAAND